MGAEIKKQREGGAMKSVRIFGKPYKLVVFDVDGVLIDLYARMWENHSHIARCLKLPPEKIEVIRHKQESGDMPIPLSLRAGLLAVWPDEFMSRPTFLGQAIRIWKALEENHPYPLIPGSLEICSKLHVEGIFLGLCTSNDPLQLYMKMLNGGLGWELFSFVVDGSNKRFRKPQPEFLLSLPLRAGVSPQETLYIGDAQGDAEMAVGAGVDFIAVRTGRVPDSEFLRLGVPPERILDSVADLNGLLSWDS